VTSNSELPPNAIAVVGMAARLPGANTLSAFWDNLRRGEESIITLAATATDGYRSYDVMNPHDDGISLDTFVDWLASAGHKIARIYDYDEWLSRFETALTGLPEQQRRNSVLPLLDAYRKPERPVRGAIAPTEVFRGAVQAAKVCPDGDIPHVTESLIDKYVSDLQRLSLVD